MQVIQPVFDATDSVLEAWGRKITSAMGAALPPEKDVDGTLRAGVQFENSVTIQFTSMGFPITFQIALPFYWQYVDAGRRAGAKPPPIDVIKRWITNKHLQVYKNKLSVAPKGYKSLSQLAVKTPKLQDVLNNLAWAIRGKIATDGIEPTPFVSSVITPDAIQELQQLLTASFKQDVIVHLNNTFAK